MKKDKKNYGHINTFVLSLVLAIAAWVAVGIVSDPNIRNTITSLPISYEGLSELEERGLIIVSPDERNSTSIVISGKRDDLIRYTKDIYMSVDVSDINETGEYSVEGTPQLSNSRISLVRERSNKVDIKVENRISKEIPVEIKQNGSNKNKLVRSEPLYSRIKIEGAESEVNAAKSALVTVDVSKITENTSQYCDFKLLDSSGTVMNKAKTLTMSADKILIEYTMYEKKTLPVKLRLDAEFENRYVLDEKKSTIDPVNVVVGVSADSTAKCVYANVNDVSSGEKNFRLIEEEGLYIPEETSTVSVKPHFIPIVSKEEDVAVKVKNLGEGLHADFDNVLEGVRLTAPENVLENTDAYFVIDLDNLGKGVHNVAAELSDERVAVDDEYTVDVIIN